MVCVLFPMIGKITGVVSNGWKRVWSEVVVLVADPARAAGGGAGLGFAADVDEDADHDVGESMLK